jgi:Uma2 family endonuclease
MTQAAKKLYTPQEYLALEETAEYKSEYYQGEIFAMAGGSINHNRIVGNVSAALNVAFANRPCEAFASDMRVQVRQDGFYTYPDVAIVCGEIEFSQGRDDTITNPVIIVEVLSPSTKNYDRTTKFELYRGLESFQDYILIDQERVYIEYHHKLERQKWVMQLYTNPAETLKFQAIEFELPLVRIYHRVKFEPEREGKTNLNPA